MPAAKRPCTKCRRLELEIAKLEGRLEAAEATIERLMARPVPEGTPLPWPSYPPFVVGGHETQGPTGMEQLQAGLEAERALEGRDTPADAAPAGSLLDRIVQVHESPSGVLPEDTNGIVWLSEERPPEPAE